MIAFITEFRRFTAVVAMAMATAVTWSHEAVAQDPEFFERPSAPNQWKLGHRLDLSQLRYCVDPRDPDWEVAAEIADAIAAALLLEPHRHMVESSPAQEDITKVYAILLEDCDFHMGFKLISGAYSSWAMLTRAYYASDYVFVTANPDIQSLSDLEPGRPIGATLGTSAHMRLVAYSSALPADARWPAYPMGTNELALDSLLNGTVDVALVWAPSLWARQRTDPKAAGLRTISSDPLPATTLGVGALMLAEQTFLRSALDQAIAALVADGTIAAILAAHDFPASAGEADER